MKGNAESMANMGNAESKALYEKYKGKRINDCGKTGCVIGWDKKQNLLVAELDKEVGWKSSPGTVESENELKEGDWYWYIVESDIIK